MIAQKVNAVTVRRHVMDMLVECAGGQASQMFLVAGVGHHADGTSRHLVADFLEGEGVSMLLLLLRAATYDDAADRAGRVRPTDFHHERSELGRVDGDEDDAKTAPYLNRRVDERT